jgi:TPR repeat protein
MSNRSTAALVAFVLALSLAAPVAAGPLEDAKAAYGHGDYAHALRLWRPLADQGNATAQYNLGLLYERGLGVTQDFAEAGLWFRKAADQGFAKAQFALGNMYTLGLGVPQDSVHALKWFNLAAARFPASEAKERDQAAKLRDRITARMTPAQIAEAQKLVGEWKPSKPKEKNKP